jgi:hypothetical protein
VPLGYPLSQGKRATSVVNISVLTESSTSGELSPAATRFGKVLAAAAEICATLAIIAGERNDYAVCCFVAKLCLSGDRVRPMLGTVKPALGDEERLAALASARGAAARSVFAVTAIDE